MLALLAVPITGCAWAGQPPRAAASAAARPGVAALVATVSSGEPTTIAAYYRQMLRWQGCDDGFKCATLVVPVDYRHPGGSRFALPVVRLPAGDPARRIGSVVVNPGGPGGSGIAFALQARSLLSADVLARFDVVGFDARGVGGSGPAIRCMTGPQLDQYVAGDRTPDNQAETSALVSASESFAQACERESGSLLPYVGTANAARDMDVLRAALHDAKLTFLGKAYGTYLGTYYAQLFPHHVRALVLDSALDPAASSVEQDTVQAAGFEGALRSFAADCLRQPDCPLSGDLTAAIAKIQSLLDQTDQAPLTSNLGGGPPANQAIVTYGIVAAAYSEQFWPFLRIALRSAFAGDGTLLVEFADALLGRASDGTYSNFIEANMAIICVDRPWPRNLGRWHAAAARAARQSPQFGAFVMWANLPCAYWPVRGSQVPAMRAAGAPPILVVGTRQDPATPYRWAQALARDLSSAVLLRWDGDSHTAVETSSPCVISIVNRYLIDGITPAKGTVCP